MPGTLAAIAYRCGWWLQGLEKLRPRPPVRRGDLAGPDLIGAPTAAKGAVPPVAAERSPDRPRTADHEPPMNILEHVAKAVLAEAGIPVPAGMVVSTPEGAARAASRFGSVMVKAQLPMGGRGKSGLIRSAETPMEAGTATAGLVGRRLGRYRVAEVLVEERVPAARELYAAVLNHPGGPATRVVISKRGGIDIEDTARSDPDLVRSLDIDPRMDLDADAALDLATDAGVVAAASSVADTLVRLHRVHRNYDAELVEVNPLAVTMEGNVVALDCKLIIDPSAASRQPSLAGQATPEPLTELERLAREIGLQFVELDGDIGVLANGAGLTMTTMDVIVHLGGRPANFLEIGGDAYTKARPALELLLEQGGIRSLVVNFCGAFARTDVMIDGLTEAWLELQPDVHAFFTIDGTGAPEATRMLRQRLGLEPYATMDQAIASAIDAARTDRP